MLVAAVRSSAWRGVSGVQVLRGLHTTPASHNVRKAVSRDVRSDQNTSFGHKAKEATRTTYYTLVVVGGVGVTGLVLYSVLKELLFSFSPQSVYSVAVERCAGHPRVVDLLGDSVKSFGEESRRGRRQHISHLPYEVDGKKGLRIKFYLQGQRRSATVQLDARETSSCWEFRYLFVQLDVYPYEVIVVEDNRAADTTTTPATHLPSPATHLPSPATHLPDTHLSSDTSITPIFPAENSELTPLFPAK